MDNGGNGVKNFFEKHGADVMTGVIIIITLLVLFSILVDSFFSFLISSDYKIYFVFNDNVNI